MHIGSFIVPLMHFVLINSSCHPCVFAPCITLTLLLSPLYQRTNNNLFLPPFSLVPMCQLCTLESINPCFIFDLRHIIQTSKDLFLAM